MDDASFDSLAKALGARGASRRGLLRGTTAGLAGAAFGLPGTGTETEAKKRKKKRKRSAQCPAGARFCSASAVGCAPGCGCGSTAAGTICADCAHCISPECQTDADCTARGLPPGTVCGDGSGGQCAPCAKVCLTPCGSCPNCACRPD
jgi:hypothetical protein